MRAFYIICIKFIMLTNVFSMRDEYNGGIFPVMTSTPHTSSNYQHPFSLYPSTFLHLELQTCPLYSSLVQ